MLHNSFTSEIIQKNTYVEHDNERDFVGYLKNYLICYPKDIELAKNKDPHIVYQCIITKKNYT